jgi:uncharacterized repeat protein (TIGR03803 family)
MRNASRIFMTRKPGLRSRLRAVSIVMSCAISLMLIMTAHSAEAQTYTVIHSFSGVPDDGSDPLGALVQDSSGNFYGTTAHGGEFNDGTIFKLDSAGTESVLYAFTGEADGGTPDGGLFRDPSGNLYGTTSQGGTQNAGVVFKLDINNALTVVYSFQGNSDGAGPSNTLVSINGVLYGTTQFGGRGGCNSSGGCGTIFKVTKAGKETVLYQFTGGADGFQPLGVIRDSAGNLYGVTIAGTSNFGTLFKLDSTNHFTVLHTFTGKTDGAGPSGRLIRDVNGNIRGAAQGGGDPTCQCGVIFEVDAAGNFKVLHTFLARTGGAEPLTGPLDDAGTLYGLTGYGGDLNCMVQGTGCGVLFTIGNTGKYSVLHRFTSGGDGEVPAAELTLGADGSIYGTTAGGGKDTTCGSIGCGTIFKYIP